MFNSLLSQSNQYSQLKYVQCKTQVPEKWVNAIIVHYVDATATEKEGRALYVTIYTYTWLS